MIETGRTYWYVNKPADVPPGELPGYLAQGCWQSPTPATHRDKLATLQPGTQIALKSVTTRVAGLPFFTGDNRASVMTIHATGVVRSVDPDAGTIGIDWNPIGGDREWYFWTGIQSPWPLTAGANPMGDQLLAFTFEGAEQDLSKYLGDPYWSSRFAPSPGLSWIPFHQEVATRLLTYRDDRAPLVAGLLDLSSSLPTLGYLTNDQFSDGRSWPIEDIDPFTFMGTFCRGLTLVNRQAVAQGVADLLGVTAPVMGDADGVPLLNNQKSWFVHYAKDRSADDTPALWRVFGAALALADTPTPQARADVGEAYDAALQVGGVYRNLSLGLFWARPQHYVPLDARSRAFLTSRYGLTIPEDGQGYLDVCDELRSRMDQPGTSLTSIPLVSYAAYRTGRPEDVPRSMSGLAHWATRMDESLDLGEVEHDFKRKAAALATEARDLARAGDPEWPATFKRALNATNTIDFRFKDTITKAILDQPDEMRAAFELVWGSPTAASLDALQAELRRLLGRVTPGNATALGALLLMSDAPEANAPYSASRTEKWYQLTGFPHDGSASSATARYGTMLTFLDALQGVLHAHLAVPASRLEAQGMAWAATEEAVPEAWSPAERAALEAWRRSGGEPPRAWLVRTKYADWSAWLTNACVSLPAAHLGDVPAGADIKAVTKAVESGYQHVDYSQRQSLAKEYFAFLSRMRPGDLVVAQSDDQVHLGRIIGEAAYVDEVDDRLRRAAQWLGSAPRAELPAVLRSALDVQGSIVDLTEHYEALVELADDASPVVDTPAPQPAQRPDELVVPAVTASLAASLHCDVEPLQEIVDLLASRRQVVLYGPPGTGKTFLSLAIAEHLVGPADTSHQQLVQFHPSYSYEDFFEGFRPYETDSGQANFRITPGPLRLIASAARQHPTKPFVLIIDEMNRANLAKVFGELYFLLEYRDRSIQLQYTPEAFQLPENLFIIGTMNTADRSIALLDAAMRRRFAFVELHPDEPPVRDVLARFIGDAHDPRPGLLAALNAAIEDTDRDFKIGPSYLMRDEATSASGLERIWKHDILPLLEEHYYGRMTRPQVRERFGLETLRRGLGTPSGDVSEHGASGPEVVPAAGESAPVEPDSVPAPEELDGWLTEPGASTPPQP